MSAPPAPAYYSDFTFRCQVCGVTVSVEDGKEQPHVCRINLDRLAGRS